LPAQARKALTEIGIPEKAISKLEVIIAQTSENYALCGSSALAVHMRSVGLQTKLNVDDLDVVYTGSNNTDAIAMHLTDALNSPQSKARATHGQILLAKLQIEGGGSFKIDLVPHKEEFATSFTSINGLSVASLDSLEVSYRLTEEGSHGEKSVAARNKLDIISAIKSALESAKSSPT
jgi:hypothetical protein